LWYGAGLHGFFSIGMQLDENASRRVADGDGASDPILNGTKGVVTIRAGFVGLMVRRGKPIVLPPGLHQWSDADVNWIKTVDLADPRGVIQLGPMTLVVCDEGRAGITADNGQQKI